VSLLQKQKLAPWCSRIFRRSILYCDRNWFSTHNRRGIGGVRSRRLTLLQQICGCGNAGRGLW